MHRTNSTNGTTDDEEGVIAYCVALRSTQKVTTSRVEESLPLDGFQNDLGASSLALVDAVD